MRKHWKFITFAVLVCLSFSFSSCNLIYDEPQSCPADDDFNFIGTYYGDYNKLGDVNHSAECVIKPDFTFVHTDTEGLYTIKTGTWSYDNEKQCDNYVLSY